MSDLAARVRAKDYTAQLTARDEGGAAVPALAPLAGDPDDEVRELAIHCLVESGAPAAGPVLAQAVLDRDSQIAVAAARGLPGVGSRALVPGLIAALGRIEEALVRRETALAVGRLGAPADAAALREPLGQEGDIAARAGLLAAMARLGDVDARESFANALVGAEGMARKPWLELAEYIGQPWLLGPLGSLLDDETPILRVGVDARPELIEALRACDLALILIADISGATFSFAVTRDQNYTPAQREEARRFVWSP